MFRAKFMIKNKEKVLINKDRDLINKLEAKEIR
jgi:hypothetical protein